MKKRTIYIYKCNKCGKLTRSTVTMKGWPCDCGGRMVFVGREVSYE